MTTEALEFLGSFFGRIDGVGSQMAARAARSLADAPETAASCEALAQDIIEALRD